MKKLLSIFGILFSIFTGINLFSKELFGLNFIIKIYQVISTSILKDNVIQLIELIFNSMTIIVCLFGIGVLFYLIIELIIRETYEINC